MGLGWGHSTRIFLDALGQLKGTRTLRTIEIDTETYQTVIEKIASEKPLKVDWTVDWGDSIKVGKKWIRKQQIVPIDLLYLDSNHQYDHVLKEIDLFGPFVSDKGVIVADDSWCSKPDTHHGDGLNHNPTDTYLAVKDWADRHGWKVLLFQAPEGMSIAYKE